jgi:hypothetical protein
MTLALTTPHTPENIAFVHPSMRKTKGMRLRPPGSASTSSASAAW